MVAVSHRQGQETENQGEVGGTGSARTQPNPQERDGRSLLSKLVFAPSADQRFRLTVEGNEDSTETDVLTSRGFQLMTGATNTLVLGDDRQTRARVSFVNIGFTNLQFGYTAIANPDLKPETSDGLEAGLHYVDDAVYVSLSGYYTRYDDFIESLVVVSQPPQTPLIVFQSQNIAEARIYGAELKTGVDLGALSAAWEGWSLRFAAAWSRGDDETADVPLDSIDPPTATLGIAYERDRWGTELAGRFVDGKDRVSDPALYRQPGYGVLDLYAHWAFAPGARVDAGVFNLIDRKYTAAGDVPLVFATGTNLDRYTSPGRNLAVSLSVAW